MHELVYEHGECFLICDDAGDALSSFKNFELEMLEPVKLQRAPICPENALLFLVRGTFAVGSNGKFIMKPKLLFREIVER